MYNTNHGIQDMIVPPWWRQVNGPIGHKSQFSDLDLRL